MLRADVYTYIKEEYNNVPNYPWARTPNYVVFRHPHNRKWFGAIVDVTEDKLGLDGNKLVDAFLLKCDPLLVGSMLSEPGILPRYHMNKKHWIIVLLNGIVPEEQVCSLIDLSYDATLK